MTRGRWVLLGALVAAIIVVVYFVFFCPSGMPLTSRVRTADRGTIGILGDQYSSLVAESEVFRTSIGMERKERTDENVVGH